MTIHPVKKSDSIPREIWKALPPLSKLVLLANGQVGHDDHGLPVVHDEVLAVTLRDIAVALNLEEAKPAASA